MRTLTVGALAAVMLIIAGTACGSDEPQTRERCERWVWDIVDSVDEPRDEVERLVAAGAYDMDMLCYAAEQRGALTDDGKIDAMRVSEVLRCYSDREDCAPRELAEELRSDDRATRLGPLARLVVFEGLVPLSDYDGVVDLSTYERDSLKRVRGFAALAYTAGVTPMQARAAAASIERSGIARFGVRREIDTLCRDVPRSDAFGCDELAAAFDTRVVARAQRSDRS